MLPLCDLATPGTLWPLRALPRLPAPGGLVRFATHPCPSHGDQIGTLGWSIPRCLDVDKGLRKVSSVMINILRALSHLLCVAADPWCQECPPAPIQRARLFLGGAQGAQGCRWQRPGCGLPAELCVEGSVRTRWGEMMASHVDHACEELGHDVPGQSWL